MCISKFCTVIHMRKRLMYMYIHIYKYVCICLNSSLPPWHLSVFSFFLSPCGSQVHINSLKTLTSSFSRSTMLLLFFSMTASHLSVLTNAPAIVFSIKPCFSSFSSSLLSLKDLFNAIFQFQISIIAVHIVFRELLSRKSTY